MEKTRAKRRRPHVALDVIHASHDIAETTSGMYYCKKCTGRFEDKLKATCQYEPPAKEYYAGWPVD